MTRTVEQITTDLTAMKVQARRYDAVLNEGGEGYNPHTRACESLRGEQEAAEEARGLAQMAARQQEEDVEWTLEVTQTRRAAWNAWAKAQRPGTVTPTQITAQVTAQGWSVEALKRQIARHGL